MIQYGDSDYWDRRYQTDPEPFEFFQRYADLKDLLKKHIVKNKDKEPDPAEQEDTEQKKPKKDDHKNAKILIIGCGNSRMSEDLYDDGYQNIMSVDSCGYLIKQMQAKYKDRNPNFVFAQMDVRGMDFKNEQFDFVLDKGLFDTVLCGEMSGKNIQKVLSEVFRVLKPGGTYCQISPAQPELRMDYIKRPQYDWLITTEQIDKPAKRTAITISPEDKDTPQVHHLYLCKKAGGEEIKIEEQKIEKKNKKTGSKKSSRSVSKSKKR